MIAPTAAAARRERRILTLESHLRVQYGMAIACIAVLAITGLAQKFDSWWIARQVLDAGGGIENVQLVHRVAGGALILVGVYHLALVMTAAVALGEQGPLRMVPTPDDVVAAGRAWLSFFGLGHWPAPAGGAHYLQKLDYWFWGWSMGLMTLTGVINLVPFRAERVLSADLVLAALRTHSDASIIVAAWVLVVHVAYSGLAPSLFRTAEPTPVPAGPDPAEARIASLRPTVPQQTPSAGVAPVAEHGRVEAAASEDWEAAP
jgi:hypothetical protein